VSKATKRERQKENRERARVERERMMKRQRQMKTARSLAFVLVPVIAILVIVTLVSGNDSKGSSKVSTAPGACGTPVANPPRSFPSAPPQTIDANASYTATVCTSEGNFSLFLDAKNAPVATNNFVFLARQGFYDGLTFHRAVKGFVIQGGDPKGDGSGGPGYTVKGEVPTNHYPIGVLAAAKTGSDPAGTFGSQFFVVTGTQGATLPNDYARFGRVNQGIAVAKKIEALAPASGDGVPTKTVKILAIQVSENGKVLAPSTAASSSTSAPSSSTSSSSTTAPSSTTGPSTTSTTKPKG
jgi:cyclophilin family peptidyl-prolyl cis-trans isomerase